jgi:hypothetical protein
VDIEGDKVQHLIYLMIKNNTLIRINGAQEKSSCLHLGTSANQLRNTINMLAKCEFNSRALKVSTVLSTVAMSVTAAYLSGFKPWVLAAVGTLGDGE